VQKSEELREFDTPPVLMRLVQYCLWQALVSRGQPRLSPLHLLAHTYMYTMDFITMHAATY